LRAIITETDRLQMLKDPHQQLEKPLYTFENPRFHGLDNVALAKVGIDVGPNGNRLTAPRYSGDFMQCIEHAHGYVCAAYQKARLRRRLPAFVRDDETAALEQEFRRLVSADVIARDCQNVMRLVAQIDKDDHDGGYEAMQYV
jgi:hypothetical protein